MSLDLGPLLMKDDLVLRAPPQLHLQRPFFQTRCHSQDLGGHIFEVPPSNPLQWDYQDITGSGTELLLAIWLRMCGVGTSLVAQWLRIHLPMQGTRVRALVWEDPTCRGATKPTRHNY